MCVCQLACSVQTPLEPLIVVGPRGLHFWLSESQAALGQSVPYEFIDNAHIEVGFEFDVVNRGCGRVVSGIVCVCVCVCVC